MRRAFIGLSVFVVATFAAVAGAFAAPQVLALLETPGPTPLVCSGGVCQAEFTTLCLQKNRQIPGPGTAYAPAEAASVILVLYGADGRQTRVAGHPGVRFEVPESYLSALAMVPEAELERLGAVRAAIEIAPLASLVPEPRPGDISPLTADEIAFATGPARAKADRVVRHAEKAMAAVRAANRYTNALLDAAPSSREARRALWREIAADARDDAARAGLPMIEDVIDTCQLYDEKNGYRGFRGCLQYRRDRILDGVNDTYWRHMDVGS